MEKERQAWDGEHISFSCTSVKECRWWLLPLHVQEGGGEGAGWQRGGMPRDRKVLLLAALEPELVLRPLHLAARPVSAWFTE